MNWTPGVRSWKSLHHIILAILPLLVVLNFYGVHTNRFYFAKLDNYIFPLLSSIHFVYIYAIRSKIRVSGMADIRTRNLEYALYALMVVYAFKIYESITLLNAIDAIQRQLLPKTFYPVSLCIVALYGLLFLLTLISFQIRKRYLGKYEIENSPPVL